MYVIVNKKTAISMFLFDIISVLVDSKDNETAS